MPVTHCKTKLFRVGLAASHHTKKMFDRKRFAQTNFGRNEIWPKAILTESSHARVENMFPLTLRLSLEI